MYLKASHEERKIERLLNEMQNILQFKIFRIKQFNLDQLKNNRSEIKNVGNIKNIC